MTPTRRELIWLFLAVPVGLASLERWTFLPSRIGKSLPVGEEAIREALSKFWPQYADADTKLYHHPPGSYGTGETFPLKRIFGWKRTFRGQQWGDFIRVQTEESFRVATVTAGHPLIQEAAYQMGLQMQETEMGSGPIDPELRKRFAVLELERLPSVTATS